MPETQPLPRKLLSPQHWPAWIGLGVVWLIARLPYGLLMRLGGALGALSGALMRTRARVAQKNLELCFPGLDAGQRQQLLHETLRESGRMLVEFALAWMGSDRALARVPQEVLGLEHLDTARATGRGVLLVGAHFSHLELCARLVSRRIPIAGMYRTMDSAVFDWAVLRARLRYAAAMFTKEELRGTVKYLRGGGTVWYAPDQDMRGKDSVFAPFFGVSASTITATHHLARLSGAMVIPFFHRRLPEGGYALRLAAPLADFPGGNVEADTARINTEIEKMVREAPAQYLWIHKRFKTRPAGVASVY